MSDNITLPREVVEGALEALDSEHPDIQLRAAIALRTHLAAEQPKHPGYIIGSHWLETAYSRICAGEAEVDVLRDCGWERVDEALRRDAEQGRWLQEALEKSLTDEQIQQIAASIDRLMPLKQAKILFARRIEAALRRED